MRQIVPLVILGLSFVCMSTAHSGGDHEQIPVAADTDWAARHMAEEHHIRGFDADTFFKLHDFDNTGAWSPDDIRRLYGLFDKSAAHIDEAARQSAVEKVLALFDADRSGTVSYAEYTIADAKGVKLPDFGFGPGHHGDDEYEYEIHHWEKYHGEDTKEEDLTHPEDIEHFRMHDEEERMQKEWESLEARGIIEQNIPQKFLRAGL